MTSEGSTNLASLFPVARTWFEYAKRKLEECGVEVDPTTELRPSDGLLCYYDLDSGHIHLSLPNQAESMGQLKTLFLRTLLGCESDQDLVRLVALYLPWVIAHELGHHARHRHGLFGSDPWREEQIANQLASAVVRQRYTLEERAELVARVRQTLQKLSEKMDVEGLAATSYRDPLQALGASHVLDRSALEQVELVQKIFSVDPIAMLVGSGQLSEGALANLARRDGVIDAFNREYTADVMKYFYYQMGWFVLDMESRERQYVSEIARRDLGRPDRLLPVLPSRTDYTAQELLACFAAHTRAATVSSAATRYFYKRYRSMLLTLVQRADRATDRTSDLLRREAQALLEIWDEGELDALDYLMQLAPPALQELFPRRVAARAVEGAERHLRDETDRRIFAHAMAGAEDVEANNTLHRIDLLDRTDVFRGLPAEILVQLTHSLCPVSLDPGEVAIWQHCDNNDVFFLVAGALEVLVGPSAEGRVVGRVRQGEAFGEIAFFTRERRTATVRASSRATCFVLRASDLRLLAFEHPTITMHLARVIARRLSALVNVSAGPTGPAPTHDHPTSGWF